MSDVISPSAENAHPGGARRFAATVILIVAWAIAVFLVQEFTTGSNYPLPFMNAVGSRVIRLLLNLSACGVAVFLLRGWVIYAVLVVCAVPSLVLLVYHDYFGKALSWTVIVNHFSEGLAVVDFGPQLLRWSVLAMVAVVTVGLLLIARIANRNPPARRMRFRGAAYCAVAYVCLAVVSTRYVDDVKKLRTFATVDRMAMTHGYLLTWYGEWRYLDAESLLNGALAAARIKQDRITPLEAPLTLGDKVVVVQVESMDDTVVDHLVDDRRVMPFLHDLSRRAMRFRLSAIHRSGSCDADFAMLMNLNPGGTVSPYAVVGFAWTPSIATIAGWSGRRSVFLHGNDRSFFRRGPIIDQMGFDRVLFREELEAQFHAVPKHWGIADRDVFAVSSRLLREKPGRALHFIITLTSHGPYHFLDPRECELFASPSTSREHYLNSMRYVDTQLKAYVSSLPDGTVIVLYGDHASHVDYGQDPSTLGHDYVPFLVYQTGADLSRIQRTRDQPIATGGELTTLDAAGYVWSLLRSDASH